MGGFLISLLLSNFNIFDVYSFYFFVHVEGNRNVRFYKINCIFLLLHVFDSKIIKSKKIIDILFISG
jgi:hypothetical protein